MANGALKLGKWTSLACAALSALAALCAGCGQENPTDEPDESLEPYHPLVPGSRWQYAHSDWEEVVTLEEGDFNGQPAFLMSDSPNPSDDLRSDAIIASVDGRVVRLEKDEFLVGAAGSTVLTSSATYGVGFTRFNEDWANQEVGFRETPEYVRIETRPGEATPRPPEARRHTFEIINLHAQVQTPTGAFDCIQIKRTKDWEAEEDGGDASDADAKTFWFARGVGKVQERNDVTGSTEVLTSYEIPASP
jgi:hypothetical protein